MEHRVICARGKSATWGLRADQAVCPTIVEGTGFAFPRAILAGVYTRRLFALAAVFGLGLAAQVDPRDSTGLFPLTDLGKGTYKGQQGGLYPGGANTPPKAHQAEGLKRAREIARRETSGKVALISIGMSNTTMEFSTFVKAAADSAIHPNLAIVDCAQSGRGADVTSKSDAPFWQVCLDRLQAAGVEPGQVAVAWVKQAYARPTEPFPAEPKKMQGYLAATVRNLHDKFPNLRIIYCSSRIYAGYANTDLNPEPHAYEGAFAVKWLIAAQIAGDKELSYDRAPWLAWGPYLWADGVKPRSDRLTWVRSELGNDGTHPSPAGREKVTKMLLEFFKTDPSARPWFGVK